MDKPRYKVNTDKNGRISEVIDQHTGLKLGEKDLKKFRKAVETPKDDLIARINNDHTYHAPTGTKPSLYEDIRTEAKDFATMLINHVPEGRELSTALSKIEEAVFWANAGIARNP